MKKCPNILLVSGSGRNVGKTSLLVSLIEKFKTNNIIAVKISPHFHDLNTGKLIKENEGEFRISKELNADNNKDSSRMLKAGAAEVYFIQVKDIFLEDAFNILSEHLPKDALCIFESGKLSDLIIPGVMIFVKATENFSKNHKLEYKADITCKISDFDNVIRQIKIKNNNWELSFD